MLYVRHYRCWNTEASGSGAGTDEIAPSDTTGVASTLYFNSIAGTDVVYTELINPTTSEVIKIDSLEINTVLIDSNPDYELTLEVITEGPFYSDLDASDIILQATLLDRRATVK